MTQDDKKLTPEQQRDIAVEALREIASRQWRSSEADEAMYCIREDARAALKACGVV